MQQSFQRSILKWYDTHKRQLPWRSCSPNPYHVWVSEIMLQQTTVPTVIPYFLCFIDLWPTIHDLAKASLDDVLHLWQGLGYYSRARNLHKCARILTNDHGGVLPSTLKELKSLPGIGDYTASAILSIAYDRPAVVVDGNVERVMARVFAVETPLPQGKAILKSHAACLSPGKRSGDYAQALMDLGSSICTPKNPSCGACPIKKHCTARTPTDYPKKAPKVQKPTRRGTLFLGETVDGDILLEKRPEKGLLGGMIGFPTSPWLEGGGPSLEAVPQKGKWVLTPHMIRHTFTHFHLELTIARGEVEKSGGGLWEKRANLHRFALPTLMKKALPYLGDGMLF